MPEGSTIGLFVAAAAVLVFMPGANTLYIVARSLQQGLMAGVVSSLGVQVGTFFHVAAAAFGLPALLLSSTLAFNIVKYAGAAYLIYLGIKTLLAREEVTTTVETAVEKSLSDIFYQGVIVNVLNPKTILFFTAFLPQFIDVERGSVAAQILFFGAIIVGLGTLSDLIYALLAGGVEKWLRGDLRLLRSQRYFAGCVYIGLGIVAALTGVSKG